MDKLVCKVRYAVEDIPKLKRIPQGDWVDVYAAEDVTLKEGELKKISLGFAMELPEGYEGHLLPRSSAADRFGIILANNQGVIDESYCGNDDIWGFTAYAIRDTEIHKGDRIGQFTIVKKTLFDIEEVEDLGNENRGGFGSTGNGAL